MASQRPKLFFRGLRALVWHEPDTNCRILGQYLHRLGLRVSILQGTERAFKTAEHDLLFFDSDRDLPLAGIADEMPIIALVGSEVPARLEWMLSHSAGSMVFKPIRSAGIYASIVFAMNSFEQRAAIQAKVGRLESKIQYRKLVIFAMIRLMRTCNYSEEQAFAYLRRKAMDERVTMESLCADIIVNRYPLPVVAARAN